MYAIQKNEWWQNEKCLAERDISKVGFRIGMGLERKGELSEVKRRSGKLSRQEKQYDQKTGRQEAEQEFGINEQIILARVKGVLVGQVEDE